MGVMFSYFVTLWNIESIKGCSSVMDLTLHPCLWYVVNRYLASLNLEEGCIFTWYKKLQSRFSYYMKIIPFYRERNVDVTHDRVFRSYSWRWRWPWSAAAIRIWSHASLLRNVITLREGKAVVLCLYDQWWNADYELLNLSLQATLLRR